MLLLLVTVIPVDVFVPLLDLEQGVPTDVPQNARVINH